MSVEVVTITPAEGAIIDVLAMLATMLAEDPVKATAISTKLDALADRYVVSDGEGAAYVVVSEIRRIMARDARSKNTA